MALHEGFETTPRRLPEPPKTGERSQLLRSIREATGDLEDKSFASWRERTGFFKGDAGLVTRLARNEVRTFKTLDKLAQNKNAGSGDDEGSIVKRTIVKGLAVASVVGAIGLGAGMMTGEGQDFRPQDMPEQPTTPNPVDGFRPMNNAPSSISVIAHPEA
jgi:hypothetical protein